MADMGSAARAIGHSGPNAEDSARLVGSRKSDAQVVAERGHVLSIDRLGLVPEVKRDLPLRGKALDGYAVDHANREPVRWILEPGTAETFLNAAAIQPEGDGMEVDGTTVVGSQLEPCGPLIGHHFVTERSEHRDRDVVEVSWDRKVEVAVIARLLTDQCIHAPTPSDPRRDAGALQRPDDLEGIGGVHAPKVTKGVRSTRKSMDDPAAHDGRIVPISAH